MFFRSRLRKTTCIFPATAERDTGAHAHTSLLIKSSKSVEHACWFGSHQLCFTGPPPSAAWVNTHARVHTCVRGNTQAHKQQNAPGLSCLRVK